MRDHPKLFHVKRATQPVGVQAVGVQAVGVQALACFGTNGPKSLRYREGTLKRGLQRLESNITPTD